ncbi:MAG: hypothetical protein U1F43_24225 [Myxococcota bacterium]
MKRRSDERGPGGEVVRWGEATWRQGAAAALALAAALGACGDSVKYIECPPGTRPEGSKCIPNVVADTTDTSSPDTATADDTSVETDSETPTDSATPTDTTSDATASDADASDAAAPRPTAAACQKNADCAGGTCLDWTGGYCTALDCGAGGCADNADLCLGLVAGNTLCVAPCASDADCRTPDQACKRILDGGQVKGVCVGVDADAKGAGGACADATDCLGAATCLSAFPGGYCASIGCPGAPCAAGSACVKVDGQPSCLRTCQNDDQCQSAEGAERKCGVLPGTSGAPVDVCVSGVAGKAMGASCLSDFECESGACQILGEGRCSQTQRPCFADRADEDCNGAEFCSVNGSNRVGVCSQPCRPGGTGCPGASYCVAEAAAPNDGWCRPACSGSDDTSTCNAQAGMRCAFGIPITDGAQGRYVCARARTGVLTSCTGAATCGQNQCLLDGSSGYCTEPCGDDGYCPFAGSCVVGTAGGDRCQRACFSSADCPSGFSCALPTGATRMVCVP